MEDKYSPLSHGNALSSLLAVHWFAFYAAWLVLSSGNTQKATRVNSTLSEGILQTNNWPAISEDGMKLHIPPDMWLSVGLSKRAAAVFFFGPGTPWYSLGALLLCPWKKLFRFCQIAMMRKSLGILWVFHHIFGFCGILPDRGKNMA